MWRGGGKRVEGWVKLLCSPTSGVLMDREEEKEKGLMGKKLRTGRDKDGAVLVYWFSLLSHTRRRFFLFNLTLEN